MEQEAQPMPESVEEDFLARARAIILTQEQKKRIADTESDLKKGLMKDLEVYGEPYGPDGQHTSIKFPRAIRGVVRFVRQRKVTTSVDEARAEAIARSKNLYDRLFKPVMTLDEGAVMVAREEGLLTDTDIAEMFPRKITWAFVPERKK